MCGNIVQIVKKTRCSEIRLAKLYSLPCRSNSSFPTHISIITSHLKICSNVLKFFEGNRRSHFRVIPVEAFAPTMIQYCDIQMYFYEGNDPRGQFMGRADKVGVFTKLNTL